MWRPIALTVFATFAYCTVTVAAESDVEGLWLAGDGDGLVDVVRTQNGLSGKVAGSLSNDPDRATTDENNPQAELRNRDLVGLELFSGFVFDGDDRWINGTIYDPDNGKTYGCVITIVDENMLKVRGYIGFSLFGRTEVWTRRPIAELAAPIQE